MKKILVVDDSALMRRVLCDIIKSDDRLEVGDVAGNGKEAYNLIKQKSYDGMILDIMMPEMDGLQLLEIMHKERIRIPTVMASTIAAEGGKETLKALELGAFDFVQKPGNLIEAKGALFREKLLSTVVLAVNDGGKKPMEATVTEQEVKKPSVAASPFGKTAAIRKNNDSLKHGNKVIALACSTGGPKSLQSVIPLLPGNIDAPMVLVQHMPVGFTKSLAERLNEISKVTVKEAEEGETLQKGWVYIAPGGKHLEVAWTGGKHVVHISDAPPIGGLRPCANVMYRSLMQSTYDEIICVVLTGMGGDGTDGITQLNTKKKIYVIAQDRETSVVYGMPKMIFDAGMVDTVQPLGKVADAIARNVGVH